MKGSTLRKIQSFIPGTFPLQAVVLKETAGGWIGRTEPAYIKEELGKDFKLVTVTDGEIGLPKNKAARIGNLVFMAETNEGKYQSLKLNLETGEIEIDSGEKIQDYKGEVDKAYRKYREGEPTWFDKWGTPTIIAAIIAILCIPTWIMYNSMTDMAKTNKKTAETYQELAETLDKVASKLGNAKKEAGTPEASPPPS